MRIPVMPDGYSNLLGPILVILHCTSGDSEQIDRNAVCHGTPGLATLLRATRQMTELAQYTGELFGKLEEETGQATGFKLNGSLRVAANAARLSCYS